jgi:hypothetical protein
MKRNEVAPQLLHSSADWRIQYGIRSTDISAIPMTQKTKRLGKSDNQKAALSVHPDAVARRLRRAVSWHTRVKEAENHSDKSAA